MADNIVFMFLGGLPCKTVDDDDNIYSHWKTLLECSSKATKINNFHIVVHPMDLNSFNDDLKLNYKLWKTHFNYNDLESVSRLHVVDDDHHVKTSWASRSLVDATLLMMQYARYKIENIKKYVLLDPSSVPLFSIDDLYHAFTTNNKSWLMSYSEEQVIRNHLTYTLTETGGIFDTYETNYFSQWMALDNQHVNYFFIEDKPTYIVEKVEKDDQTKKVYCDKRTNKIVINPELGDSPEINLLKSLLYSFETLDMSDNSHNLDSLDYNVHSTPCSATDEHFFGMFIYYKLFKLSHSPQQYLEKLQQHLTTRYQVDIIKSLLYFKQFDDIIYNLSTSDSTHMQVNIYSDGSVRPTYDNNIFSSPYTNTHHVFTPGPYNLNQGQVAYKLYSKMHNDQKYILKRITNLSTILTKNLTTTDSEVGNYKHNLRALFYPVSCTYTNWNQWSPDPFNILRGCSIGNKSINMTEYLDKTSLTENIKYLTDLVIGTNNTLSDYITAYKTPTDLYIKMMTYHPIEYTEWSIINIINAFIFVSLFRNALILPETGWPQQLFKIAYDSWKACICDYFKNYNETIRDIPLIDIPDINYKIPYLKGLPDILEPFISAEATQMYYGNYVTPDVFKSAISSGSLFIRKCTKKCKINKYSEFICNNLDYSKLNCYIGENCLDKCTDYSKSGNYYSTSYGYRTTGYSLTSATTLYEPTSTDVTTNEQPPTHVPKEDSTKSQLTKDDINNMFKDPQYINNISSYFRDTIIKISPNFNLMLVYLMKIYEHILPSYDSKLYDEVLKNHHTSKTLETSAKSTNTSDDNDWEYYNHNNTTDIKYNKIMQNFIVWLGENRTSFTRLQRQAIFNNILQDYLGIDLIQKIRNLAYRNLQNRNTN